jgi:acyl-CoA thioesterase-2
MRRFLVHARPFEFRPVEPIHVIPPPRADPLRHIWVKTVDRLPDDPDLHRNVLAYVSDYQLVATSTLPHGIHFAEATCSWRASITQCGFTGPFRVDDWLLYAMQSPNASGGRGFALGRFSRAPASSSRRRKEGVVRVWR